MSDSTQGKLVVLSGPSGAGKTTVIKQLLDRFADRLVLSVSATTRPPRPGERDGVDYHFLSPEEFERRRVEGQFVECCEVFGRGHWYGTLKSEVRSGLDAGKWVLLEIDVEGAQAILKDYPEALTIFVRPSSLDELQRRLRARGTESDEVIERRLAVARHELQLAKNYQHQVINDTVSVAVDQITRILTQSEADSL